MRFVSLTLTISLLLLIVGCSNPADDKAKALTGQATSASPQTAAGATEKYSITPQESKVEFVGSKVTGSHTGSFKDFTGTIDYAGSPEKSSVNVTIDMNSLATDDEGLTKHLKTADFFDVEKFTQATFNSTEIKPGGDKGASHTVTGNLQLHGVTKSISFPATINVTGEVATVDSSFSINRKDFGINYAGAANNLIRDEVVLTLQIKAPKAK